MSSDPIDAACDREERDREIALKMRKPILPNVYACYNCGEDCEGIFCSPECRDDYMQRERFRNGN